MLKIFIIIYLIINLSQCNILDEENNIRENFYIPLKTEKLDEFYNYFKKELNNGELKKFYLKLLQLDSDTQNLIKTNEFVSEKAKNDFINYGIKLIHKNFLLDKSLENFIKGSKMDVNDSLEDNLPNIEWLEDEKKQKYSKIITDKKENFINKEKISIKQMKKNSDFMKVEFDDVHPKFFDDEAFETENFNLLENYH